MYDGAGGAGIQGVNTNRRRPRGRFSSGASGGRGGMSAYQGHMFLLNQAALSNALRRVWVDYISWTTALIYTILFGTHDQSAIEARLKQNARDYADIFAQFYGDEAGTKLRALFEQYQEEITYLIQSHKENDISGVASHRQALYAIADQVALMLSRLNPYWDQASIQIGLYEITNLYEEEIVHILQQEFGESIEAYDELLAQSYRISDELLLGIQQQFRL
jgi:hypothetical protein